MTGETGVAKELPRFQSHKVVHAIKIADVVDPSGPNEETDGSRLLIPADEGYAPIHVGLDYVRKHAPEEGGYYVVYPDGYKSFSPAESFESGYLPVKPVVKARHFNDNLSIQIDRSFRYHTPKDGQPERYVTLRDEARKLANLINDECPDSREKSLAITKLEETIMWANAAIARNE